MKTLQYNLKTTVVPITFTLENGQTEDLEMREMPASDRDKYLDTLGARVRVDVNGKPCGIKKFEGMQADLLTLCVFHKATNKPVIKEEVQKWPASVVSSLYEEAQELNHLKTAEEEKPKND